MRRSRFDRNRIRRAALLGRARRRFQRKPESLPVLDFPRTATNINVSGCAASMAAFHRVRRINGWLHIYHFNPMDGEYARNAEILVSNFCRPRGIDAFFFWVMAEKPENQSFDAFFKDQVDLVYEEEGPRVFDWSDVLISSNGHRDPAELISYEPGSLFVESTTLDDVIECHLLGIENGQPLLIPFHERNIYRPFLLATRKQLQNYCKRRRITYLDRPNEELSQPLLRIRTQVLPAMLKAETGLYRRYQRMILDDYFASCSAVQEDDFVRRNR